MTKFPKPLTSESEMTKEIPVTYVPARNSIFLSLAASLAETQGAEAIYFGANALDYSGYPDCRPEFIEAFEEMMRRGTKVGVTKGSRAIVVRTPLLRLSKAEIVRLGLQLGVPFESTWSCYEGKEIPCGECDSCILRAKGFREAGVEDPLEKSSLRAKKGDRSLLNQSEKRPVPFFASATLGTPPRNDGKRYA